MHLHIEQVRVSAATEPTALTKIHHYYQEAHHYEFTSINIANNNLHQ